MVVLNQLMRVVDAPVNEGGSDDGLFSDAEIITNYQDF
jgi:hypothetical protein